MKLATVHVKEFQSVLDSGEFKVGEITCLVGKNEAGKTAVLQALYRLNPFIPADANYSVTDDYPRRDVEDYRLEVEAGKRQPAVVVRATFELEGADIDAVAAVVGPAALRGNTITMSKGYLNTPVFHCEINDNAALTHLAVNHQCPAGVMASLESCETVSAAEEVLTKAEQTESVEALAAQLLKVASIGGFSEYVFEEALKAQIPRFLYFDEYYQMKGRANLEALKKRVSEETLRQSDYPLLGLINRARLKLDDLLNPARTRELKNRLEGAGNHLTKQIIEYWSQNKYLQLRFDVRPGRPNDPEDMKQGTNIWSDVYDSKHMVTTELGTRSRGFVWFFSFLAWYGDVRGDAGDLILLLDEPGLSLHGKAQGDLLRYFEAEMIGSNQLIYTTHSPFMVDPRHFERVRIVQDRSIDTSDALPPAEDGTKVLVDVLEATGDSLFPLQGALGYEIYQTLFIGPNCLVVEGVSDLLYLQVMTSLLAGC
jgi:predicted ATP-dependent endonuclease of OLD family